MALNFDRFCMGCMGCETEEGKPCPLCGFDESAYAPAANALPLRTILNGKYLLGKTIGQGGFGIIYLGWDLNLDMKLAIKEYYPDGFVTRDSRTTTLVAPYAGESEEFFADGLGKFIDEAKRLAKFYSLPGIVSVRDYFRENGTAYIIMEFIEGQTLKDYLAQKGGRLSLKETLRMARPLMESLATVHDHDIIHRDISPDNIMMDRAGHFRLIDFGAAREFGKKGSQTILLKPGYAPYEQYQSDGAQQGPWTDIYALCATIYRCITGEIPLEASKRLPVDSLKKPSDFPGVRIDAKTEEVLLKGLSIFSQGRWKSMGELQAALYGETDSDDEETGEGITDKGKKQPQKPDEKQTEKEDTPQIAENLIKRLKDLPSKTLGLAAGGCAALILLVLLVPRLLSLGNTPIQDISSSGVSGSSISAKGSEHSKSSEGQPVSLAVPPAAQWKESDQGSASSQEEQRPAVKLRQPDDPDAVVKLTDWALEYHLRTALGKPDGDFTAGELAQIQRLHIRDITCTVNADPPEGSFGRTVRMGDGSQVPHVAGLTDLKYFINLRELTLTDQDFGNLSPLSQLTELTALNIEGNGSEGMDYSPLSNLTSLEKLGLENMRYYSLTDLSFLAGLENLRELDLSENRKIASLAPLKNLTKLETLNLEYVGYSVYKDSPDFMDLSPLAGMASLRELNLRGCPINALGPLSGLISLRELKIQGMGRPDISPLAGLTGLTRLELSSCRLTDISLLSGLTALTELNLKDNQITDLSPLKNAKNLTTLRADGNNITDWSPVAHVEDVQGRP